MEKYKCSKNLSITLFTKDAKIIDFFSEYMDFMKQEGWVEGTLLEWKKPIKKYAC